VAGQRPAAAKPETGAETAEQDVAAAEALAGAEPAADPRDSALANLLNGTPEPAVTPADEPAVDVSNVQDFGGRSRAVVLVSYYNQFVDGVVKGTRKGAVIDTDAESLKRGIRIKALRKLEG
jgi:hypothetical protein